MQSQRELLEDFAVVGRLSVESSETQGLGMRQGPNFCGRGHSMNVQVDNLDNVTSGSESHPGAALGSLDSQLCLGCGSNLELSKILPCVWQVAVHSTSQGGEEGERPQTHVLLQSWIQPLPSTIPPPVTAVSQGLV